MKCLASKFSFIIWIERLFRERLNHSIDSNVYLEGTKYLICICILTLKALLTLRHVADTFKTDPKMFSSHNCTWTLRPDILRDFDIIGTISGDIYSSWYSSWLLTFSGNLQKLSGHAHWSRDPPWPNGYDALLPSVSSQVRVSAGSPSGLASGRYINVRRCGGLSMVLLQLKDPLELFVKSIEFPPGSGFLSRRDMTWAVESDVKPHSFLPFAHWSAGKRNTW